MNRPIHRSMNLAVAILAAHGAFACSGDATDAGNETELITTVTLVLTPTGAGTAVTVEFDDPDGDGGDPPTVDPLDLDPGSYELAVGFENRLENPAEVITDEVADEADEHQIFVTGSAVSGPGTSNAVAPLAHAYADADAASLPIGLQNTITATTGAGDLVITLRHLPPIGGGPAKVSGLAESVAASGFASIGGTTDAQVTFAVTVP